MGGAIKSKNLQLSITQSVLSHKLGLSESTARVGYNSHKRLGLFSSQVQSRSKISSHQMNEWSTMEPVGQEENIRMKSTSRLGKGALGVVYEGIIESDGQQKPVAIKNIENLDEFNRMKLIEISNLVKDSNIVAKALKIIPDIDRNCYVVLEFCSGQNIDYWIKSRNKPDSKPLSITQKLQVLYQVMHGLQSLHEKNIIHRDIKPANIMYDHETGEARIIDLDSSCFDKGVGILGTTERYRAEEANTQEYDTKYDIYSLGMTMLDLLYDQNNDYKRTTKKQLLENIQAQKNKEIQNIQAQENEEIQNIEDQKNKEILEWLNPILVNMVDQDPKKRMSADEIIKKINSHIEASKHITIIELLDKATAAEITQKKELKLRMQNYRLAEQESEQTLDNKTLSVANQRNIQEKHTDKLKGYGYEDTEGDEFLVNRYYNENNENTSQEDSDQKLLAMMTGSNILPKEETMSSNKMTIINVNTIDLIDSIRELAQKSIYNKMMIEQLTHVVKNIDGYTNSSSIFTSKKSLLNSLINFISDNQSLLNQDQIKEVSRIVNTVKCISRIMEIMEQKNNKQISAYNQKGNQKSPIFKIIALKNKYQSAFFKPEEKTIKGIEAAIKEYISLIQQSQDRISQDIENFCNTFFTVGGDSFTDVSRAMSSLVLLTLNPTSKTSSLSMQI